MNHYDPIEKIFYYDLSRKRLKQWIVKTKTRIKEKTNFAFSFKPTFLREPVKVENKKKV